jgi:hypothetical protein
MPQGNKSSYTHKAGRKTALVKVGHEEKGAGVKPTRARASGTVNKLFSGGKKCGPGRKSHEQK